jgi:hypothetical protein
MTPLEGGRVHRSFPVGEVWGGELIALRYSWPCFRDERLVVSLTLPLPLVAVLLQVCRGRSAALALLP